MRASWWEFDHDSAVEAATVAPGGFVQTSFLSTGGAGDTITTQELFSFQFQGESADGMLRGVFKSGGIRPYFLPRAEYYGLERPLLEVI